jgi:hypothetical protein
MKRVALIGILTSLALRGAPVRADTPSGSGKPADEKAVCLDAVSKGQPLRDAHQLVEARDQFQICARAECPARLRTDCASWLSDIERTVPTVVLSAKDGAGRDVADVKVTVDYKPFVDRLDGHAIAVDPGMRTFRFLRSDGSVVTEQALIKEGEKARNVSVVLLGGASSDGSRVPVSHEAGGVTPDAPTPGGTARAVGLVLGVVGVVTLAVGFGVALDAKSKDDQAKNESGPAQQWTDSGSAISEGNAATVVLGVGAAVAITGAVLWLTAPRSTDGASQSSSASRRSLGVGTNGRALILRGTFW